MPMYDYRCRDCDHEFEIHQAFSDDPLTECPQCGGNLRKVFSPVGISFKGSGFYKTDSQGTSSATKPPGSSGDSSDKGSKDSSSSDAGSSSKSGDSKSGGDSSSSSSEKSSSTGSDKGSSTTSAA
jgi:putative FmdB family regulatory protein